MFSPPPTVSPSPCQATSRPWLSQQEPGGLKLWRTNPRTVSWVMMHDGTFYLRSNQLVELQTAERPADTAVLLLLLLLVCRPPPQGDALSAEPLESRPLAATIVILSICSRLSQSCSLAPIDLELQSAHQLLLSLYSSKYYPFTLAVLVF